MNVLHRSVGTTGAKQTFRMAAMLVSGRSLAARKGRCFHFRQKSGSVRITGPDRLCMLDIGWRALPGIGSAAPRTTWFVDRSLNCNLLK